MLLGYEMIGHTTRDEDALRLAEQLQPDLVLMDIQLAGPMDGIAVVQTLLAQLALPAALLTA